MTRCNKDASACMPRPVCACVHMAMCAYMCVHGHMCMHVCVCGWAEQGVGPNRHRKATNMKFTAALAS